MYEQKFAVTKHELYECGLCPNPYPYMCEECNMEAFAPANAIQQNVINTTSQHWELLQASEEKEMKRVFVGSGDFMTWDFDSNDCSCEQCSIGD